MYNGKVIDLILSLEYLRGCMESPNPKFALYGETYECARTNKVLLALPEVSTGLISLRRPSVARAVLQTDSSLISLLTD